MPAKKTNSRSKKRNKNKHWPLRFVLIIIIVIAAGVSMFWSEQIELKLGLLHEERFLVQDSGSDGQGQTTDDPKLKVHFLDVGQGDSCIIELPDGKNMIIDAGSGTSASSAAINYVKTYITNLQIEFFDYAILTHEDADHCNILDDVLGQFPSKVFYRPNVEAMNPNDSSYIDPGKVDLTPDAQKRDQNPATYRNVIDKAYAANALFTPEVIVTDASDNSQTIKSSAGQDSDEYYTLTFYTPTQNKYNDPNDYSPIMILNYQGFNFALSGDAEAANENEFANLVNQGQGKYSIFDEDFSVNVLKLGHHGSSTSSSENYLNIMTKAQSRDSVISIISCGEGNSYQHPHTDVLTRFEQMGFDSDKIYRTDLDGTIVVSVENLNNSYSLFVNNTYIDTPEYYYEMVYYKVLGIEITWMLAAIFIAIILSAIIIGEAFI